MDLLEVVAERAADLGLIWEPLLDFDKNNARVQVGVSVGRSEAIDQPGLVAYIRYAGDGYDVTIEGAYRIRSNGQVKRPAAPTWVGVGSAVWI